ncbi:MAG: hypothetical protein ABIR33_11220 [Pyrinomonadaceae bacterium]
MQIRFFLSLFALVFGLVTVLPQQPDPDATKLKDQRRAALVARIVGDAEQLKLPDNRAILNARLGAMAWKDDPERAKKLLQSAVSDLNASQQEAEATKGKVHLYQDLLTSQNLRPQISNTIATVDPEYALESFYRTRPTAVARAMTGESDEKLNDQAANTSYFVQAEINLEQRLLRLVADRNPRESCGDPERYDPQAPFERDLRIP